MLEDMYQEMILDHGRSPRNCGELASANCCHEGYNPLCGDRVKVSILEYNEVIQDVRFSGDGCAICMASASLMTESIKGKKTEVARQVFDGFHQLLTKSEHCPTMELGKLAVFRGVSRYPMRVKCATLPWHTLLAALDKQTNQVSTE